MIAFSFFSFNIKEVTILDLVLFPSFFMYLNTNCTYIVEYKFYIDLHRFSCFPCSFFLIPHLLSRILFPFPPVDFCCLLLLLSL
jgi:hypothetical protein